MKKLTMAALACCTILSACSGGTSNSVDSNEERLISIAFAAEANNVAIDCDTQLTGLGTQNSNAMVKEFRFYIHDVSLIDNDGKSYDLALNDSVWNHQNLVLLDFMNKDTSCSGSSKSMNTDVSGVVSVPATADLTGIRFTLGVPSSLNHADRATASAPLDQTSLHWNWQNGYKFARLDVAPIGGIPSWNFHLGSTDCTGSPQAGEDVICSRPNRPSFELSNFDHTTDTITLDFGALVENIDLTQDLGGKPGCMSGATDPECYQTFKALGLDVTTGNADPTITQTVFRVN